MRDEALARFRLNSFIVVSHRLRGIEMLKHNFDIPLVTQKNVYAFAQYDMRLHFQAPKSVLAAYEKEPLRSFVILAKHLPQLCRVLQLRYYIQPPAFPLIVKKKNQPQHKSFEFRIPIATPGPYGKFQTKIRFSPEAKNRLKIEDMNELVKPFNDLIVGDQSITLCNNSSPELDIEQLKHRMGPSAVWPKAMAWHLFETIRSLLYDAEKFVESGHFMHACRRYRFITDIYTPCILLHLLSRDHYGASIKYSEDTLLPLGLIARALLNAIATFGFLHMRVDLTFGPSGYLVPTITGLYELIDQLPLQLKQQLAPFHDLNISHLGCTAHNALQLFIYNRSEKTLSDVLGIFNALPSLIPSDEHIAFDLKMVKQTCEDASHRSDYLEATPNPKDLWKKILTLMGQSSACQLPVKLFNSEPPIGLTKPLGLDGFVDTAHLDNIRAKDPKKAEQITNGTLLALEAKGAMFFHTGDSKHR